MKEIAKKYWFVGVIALILVSMVVYLVADQISKIPPSKTVDGKNVVFEYNGKDYTADDFYESMYDDYGLQLVVVLLENELYYKALEPTADMQSEAKLTVDQYILQFKQQYGENYKEELRVQMLYSGYRNGEADLNRLVMTSLIRQQVITNYLDANQSYYEQYAKDNNPVNVSHILVKMADSANPTDEEKAKMTTIEEALAKEGAVFGEVAKEYSDDSSKTDNGKVGITDKNNSAGFVTEFAEAIKKLEVGQQSEWVKTTYGYHLIRVDSAVTYDEFKKTDTFITSMFKAFPNLDKIITKSEIDRQEFTVSGNEELQKKIEEYYTIKEDAQ